MLGVVHVPYLPGFASHVSICQLIVTERYVNTKQDVFLSQKCNILLEK